MSGIGICMYAKVVVVLYCLQIPRYFVVEDVIWDAATTVIMIMITVRISYSSFLPYFRRAFYPGTHTFRRGDELDFSLSLSATVGFHVPSLAKS